MIYVFTFLGEFGYELFNWQGVVRKFSTLLKPDERIVCAGRTGLASWYESAAKYIEVSDEALFRQSLASDYFAIPLVNATDQSRVNYVPELRRLRSVMFDLRLRRALKARVLAQLPPVWRQEPMRWVFSSGRTRLRGLNFGAERFSYGWHDGIEGNIYTLLDLGNNLYRKIQADEAYRDIVVRKLGFDLTRPFVLVQTRVRAAIIRSHVEVPKEELIAAVARRCTVVLLTFSTGRALDSFSAFNVDKTPNVVVYPCGSFNEQSVLVAAARRCLFFTEGDFGSHIYVPPFMGKDVVAIAPHEVYCLGTTPIDFWNNSVFQFGGQIQPLEAENVFASQKSVETMADGLLAR
jgi:hypothetical protein